MRNIKSALAFMALIGVISFNIYTLLSDTNMERIAALEDIEALAEDESSNDYKNYHLITISCGSLDDEIETPDDFQSWFDELCSENDYPEWTRENIKELMDEFQKQIMYSDQTAKTVDACLNLGNISNSPCDPRYDNTYCN